MLQIITGIRDQKTGAFLGPFSAPALGAAARWFADLVNAEQSPFPILHQHPEDFELLHLAMWDDQTGEFQNVPAKVVLTGAVVVSQSEFTGPQKVVNNG